MLLYTGPCLSSSAALLVFFPQTLSVTAEKIINSIINQGRITPLIPAAEYNYLLFSHFWLATVQDVLQADWQEA
jgi:hypothetical protein